MVAQESPLSDPQGQPSPGPTEKETRNQTFRTWIIVAVVAVAITVAFPESTAAKAVIWAARFALILGVLVFVHEWGHYQFARWAGMKVNRFAIGFPPWIFTKRHKGIDYSIGALPIGGMVDIAGISEEEMVHTATSEGAANAAVRRRVRGVPLPPRGERHFHEVGLGWRFMTLFAGPMMNFIYFLVMAIALFTTVGVPVDSTVSNKILSVPVDMPADRGGVQAGDKIVGVNGVRTDDQSKLYKAIRGFKGENMPLLIERDGKTITKTIKPLHEEQPTADGKGTESVAVIGVEFAEVIHEYKKLTVSEAAQFGVQRSFAYAQALYQLLGRAVIGQLSPMEKRSIGGPVAIGRQIETSSKRGWYDVMVTSIMLSLSLGLMNLLPIPALDGGRIMFLGYELIARRPVDARKEGFINMVGMLMVLSFMALLTVRDILPYIVKGIRTLTSG